MKDPNELIKKIREKRVHIVHHPFPETPNVCSIVHSFAKPDTQTFNFFV